MREYFLFLFRVMVEILLSRVLKTELERKYFLILKENQILRRKYGKRPPELEAIDRHFYVTILRTSRRLLNQVLLIRPETILAWHRKLAALKDGLDSGRVGRPGVTEEIKKLAIEMKKANPRWGCKRIAGEIGKLGMYTCRNTIARILREAGFDDPPTRARARGISWRAFMKSQGERIWACDFFTVSTLFLKKLQIFFMMDIQTRRIEMVAIHPEPTQQWLKVSLKSFFAFCENAPQILISDNGSVYRNWLKPFLRDDYGIELRQIPPYCPQLNGYAERMVRTFREELTDRVLVYNEQDLEKLVREYVCYFNSRRTHSSIGGQTPNGTELLCLSNTQKPKDIPWRARPILGGLITDFEQAA